MVHVYFKGSGVLVFEPKDERKVGESCPLLPATFLHILYTPMMSCRLSLQCDVSMEVW
jgi:hypothetical protein